MAQLETLVRLSAKGFLFALVVVVAYKILSRTISLRWLLTGERCDGTLYFSLGRAQLLVVAFLVSGDCVRRAFMSTAYAAMTDVPAASVVVVAASQALYLLEKAYAFRTRFSTSANK
jgi:hypothetical protein